MTRSWTVTTRLQSGLTVKQAARALNVSERIVYMARRIVRSERQDLITARDTCAKAGIPAAIDFRTKPQIALDQIRAACEADLPRGVVLMDAGYGSDTRLREEIGALGLAYVAGIQPQTSVWAPGTPLPAKGWSGQGRPRRPKP